MIIAQAPLRVSLFGGGSDLPAYLEASDGAVLSFAIDKRVYIVGHPLTHREGLILKYSRYEDVQYSTELQHPIARVILGRYGLQNMDIAVMSDVPAGTGLGSSSSFTVALISFVRNALGLKTTASDLAKEAIDVEINVLGEPIGFQDQWAAAVGGINLIRFHGLNEVEIERIAISAINQQSLQKSLILLPIGKTRSASALLQKQGQSLKENPRTRRITQELVAQVDEGKKALVGEIDTLGPLLHEAWQLKREISSSISNSDIDELYVHAMNSGSTGGKLLGAGGSGYLACYVPQSNIDRFKSTFHQNLQFSIAESGAGIIYEN